MVYVMLKTVNMLAECTTRSDFTYRVRAIILFRLLLGRLKKPRYISHFWASSNNSDIHRDGQTPIILKGRQNECYSAKPWWHLLSPCVLSALNILAIWSAQAELTQVTTTCLLFKELKKERESKNLHLHS